jgi:hypothetical protein
VRPIVLGASTLYYVAIIIKKSLDMQNSSSIAENTSGVVYAHKNNFRFFNSLLYVISYPVVMYTGAIRLIKHEHYIISLKNNHLIELLGQTVPLLIIKTLNQIRLNDATKTVDALYLAIGILNILNIAIELFMNSHVLKVK